MKGKETVTVACPCCGGTLQVQGQALFKEHHKRLWYEKAEEYGVDAYNGYDCFGDLFYQRKILGHDGFMHRTLPGQIVNKPDALVQWERSNPIPQIDLIDFVVNFAQKGGLR